MPRERIAARQGRAARIAERLENLYPDARCTLDYANPFELWVATALSAQSTDERVNLVTPALFAEVPDAASLARLPLRRLESLIRSIGLYRNKARNLKSAAKIIVEEHGGRVPATMAELTALPGVGRKTANVILGNAFGEPGFPVDTHVGRVTRRLGLTRSEDPVKIETELTGLFAPARWTKLSHQFIRHGREICHGRRRPECSACGLAELCPGAGKF